MNSSRFTTKPLLVRALSSLTLIAVLGLCWWLLEAFKPEPQEKPNRVKKVNVFVEKIASKATRLMVEAQGKAQPKSQIQMKSQIEGRVDSVSPQFVAGGRFKKGDVLVELESQDYQLLLIQRQARVAQSRENLAKVQAESSNAIAELTQLARTNASQLAKKLPQLARAKAELASSEAALKQAQLNLQRTQIIAPFDGMVRSENVAIGQFVTRSTSLGEIFSIAEMEIRLPLRGSQLSQLGLPLNYFVTPTESDFAVTITAQLGDLSGTWYGHIIRTEGAIDANTRSMYGVVHVAQPYQQDEGNIPLVAGLYVNASIQGRIIANATTVPRKAIRTDNKIWLLDKQNKLRIKQVEVISRNHKNAVITGLQGQSTVVTSALVMAVDGLSVRPIEPSQVATDAYQPATIKATPVNPSADNNNDKTERRSKPRNRKLSTAGSFGS